MERELKSQESLFNFGIANLEGIYNALQDAYRAEVYNLPTGRARALCAVKKMVSPEFDKKEEKAMFDSFEKQVKALQVEFYNILSKFHIGYNAETGEYVIEKGENEFSRVYNAFTGKMDQFEEALREKLAPFLFPKSADRRFALAGGR